MTDAVTALVSCACTACRLQVSFLLPPDHGFDPATTTVGLLQHTGCLYCTPKHLSEFSAAPLNTPGPFLADNTSSASPRGSSSSSSPQALQGLQLLQLQEDAAAYTATIRIGGSEPCSGLTVLPTVLSAAARHVTHEIGFSVAKPQGLGGLQLRLLHPVDSSAASEPGGV